MKTIRTISWAEFSQMDFIGRDLVIAFETLVERARIKEVTFGSDVMFCFEKDGASARASGFQKREDDPWRPQTMLPYSVRCKEDNQPQEKDNGMIVIRTLGPYYLVIQKAGDNLELPIKAS